MTRSAADEREAILARTARPLVVAMHRAARATAMGDSFEHTAAVEEMGRCISQVLGLCWLLGARRTLLLFRAAARREKFAASPAPLVPAFEFEAAVESLLKLEPKLEIGWKAVQEALSKERGFALAKSADLELTFRVQKAIAEGMRSGRGMATVEEAVKDATDWTRAYAENVYRTNAASAYTAGQFEMARDEDVSEVMTAFEYQSVNDADTRPNHRAADGLVAATDDPIWHTYSPPLGFQCRCNIRLVSKYELEGRGLYSPATGKVTRSIPPNFAQAHPDDGFVTRGPR